MIEPRFYMGYTRNRPNHIIPLIEGEADVKVNASGELELVPTEGPNIGILKNAQLRWSRAQERFLDMWEYDTHRVIDSGGYNVQSEWGKSHSDGANSKIGNVDQSALREELDWVGDTDSPPFYPWSIPQYHDWLAENAGRFDWAAVMDYACESRFDPLWNVEERIEATIHNTIRHFDLLDGEYDLLPVLQGRTLDDYLYCYDRLEEAGIPVRKVGLGTVCRLSSSREIVELERGLREAREFDHIHGFGVKIDAYKMGCGFESADSQAWVWHASHGEEYRDEGSRLGSLYVQPETYPGLDTSACSLRRTVVSFREYYRYVSRLRDGRPALPPLTDEHTIPDGVVRSPEVIADD